MSFGLGLILWSQSICVSVFRIVSLLRDFHSMRWIIAQNYLPEFNHQLGLTFAGMQEKDVVLLLPGERSCLVGREEKKIWTISRFVRVILAQGPC